MDAEGNAGGTGYRLSGRAGRTFDPAQTALLVIDPVNDFLSESAPLGGRRGRTVLSPQ